MDINKDSESPPVPKEELPPLRWADRISATRHGDVIKVQGEIFIEAKENLFDRYVGDPPPHLEFANCASDVELTAFVGKYGPVLASKVSSKFLPAVRDHFSEAAARIYPGRTQFTRPEMEKIFEEEIHLAHLAPEPSELKSAIQNVPELRHERDLFRTAIALRHMLLSSPDDRVAATPPLATKGGRKDAGRQTETERLVAHLENLAKLTQAWTGHSKREQAALKAEYRYAVPQWRWESDQQQELEHYVEEAKRRFAIETNSGSGAASLGSLPLRVCVQRTLSCLLNAFPLTFLWYGDYVMDVPPTDLSRGIRPVLFAMLRRDIHEARGVRLCSRIGCNNYFFASRTDKQCCSVFCSTRLAARRYYEEKRRPARQEAAKSRRKKNAKTKSKSGKG